MALMQILYKTYENLAAKGVTGLLLPAQSTQQAHVEVLLDKNGEFRMAEFIEKDDATTNIPVTEDSASRSSGVAPHPLFDKLKYLAGDYEKYCGEDNTKYHEAYMEQLGAWCDSEYAVPQVESMYEYLQQNTLIADLIAAGIFSQDEKGMLTKNWEKASVKLTTGDQADAFLRFRVASRGENSVLWERKDIQEQFLKFYLSHGGKQGFCCVTGKEVRLCGNHPSKIRHSADKAKLISSNDKTNFTYRGRLEEPGQIFTIGYEASQKAHNELKYLVQIQGAQVGEKVFELWGAEQEKTPALFSDTKGLVDEAPGADQEEEATAERIAEAFQAAMMGYRRELREDSQLVLAGFDAATTGRLALIFYREYNGKNDCNELIDHIESWHKTCAWNISYVDKNGDRQYYVGVPAPFHIARAIYGTDQNGKLDGNKKVIANAVERFLPCISDGKKIPRDMVHAAVNKARFPQNYSSLGLWYQILATACALYKKYLYDYKKITFDLTKEEWKMGLSGEDKVAYDCGRLLAVADAIERWALRTKADDSKNIRATTAMRYYTRFSQKPCEAWKQIYNKLIPYRIQLGEKGAYLYNLMGEISEQLANEDFAKAKNLNGMFCLGFDSMRTGLIRRSIAKSKERQENNSASGSTSETEEINEQE